MRERKTKKKNRAPRDTHNYKLVDEWGNVVYYGVTKTPKQRYRQHKRGGKQFSEMEVSPKRSRARALNEETKSIHRYQDNNLIGNAPRYNIAKVKRSNGIFNNFFGFDLTPDSSMRKSGRANPLDRLGDTIWGDSPLERKKSSSRISTRRSNQFVQLNNVIWGDSPLEGKKSRKREKDPFDDLFGF